MIIRRRHTANFTTIGNDLVNDTRLKADELGVMTYLLSRPNDWEVRRSQLGKRFDLGRDSIKRIVFNCIRFGWMVGKKTREANGTFKTEYEVRDQPGPTLSPEEVNIALSLVSSEATAITSDDDTATEPPASAGPPDPGQPATADQLRQTRSGPYKEELLNTDSVKPEPVTERECAREDEILAKVIRKYPSGAVDDQARITKAWDGLAPTDWQPAYDGIDPFLAELKAAGRKHPPALWKYIEERRWQLLNKASTPAAANVTMPNGWSREWWIVLFDRIAKRDPSAMRMVSFATQYGPKPFPIKPEEAPTAERIAEFKSYPTDGHAYEAWQPWFAKRGIRLPAWQSKQWVFLPSPEPPDSKPEPHQLSDQDARDLARN